MLWKGPAVCRKDRAFQTGRATQQQRPPKTGTRQDAGENMKEESKVFLMGLVFFSTYKAYYVFLAVFSGFFTQ